MDRGVMLSRLRGMEFRAMFPKRLVLRRSAAEVTLLARLLLWGWVVVGVLWGWLWVSWARGGLVEWAPAPTLRLAVPWLLWGLGGAIPVLAAFACGWAWAERTVLGLSARRRPLVDLLPLSNAQVLSAKLQGRTAAFLVWFSANLGILALARALMVAGHLVSRPPSLLDPWLAAAVPIFYALFIASTHIATAARRWHPDAAWTAPMVALILSAAAALAIGYAGGCLTASRWLFPRMCALAAAGITAGAVAELLPAWRRLQENVATGAGRRVRSGAADEGAQAGAPTPPVLRASRGWWGAGLRNLGGHRGHTLRWLKASLVLGLKVLLAATLLGIVLQTVIYAWHVVPYLLEYGHVPSQASMALEDSLTLAAYLPLFVLGCLLLISPVAAWPEGAGRGMQRPQQPFPGSVPVLRHLSVVLPARSRDVWRERIVSLLLVAVQIMLVGIISHALVWRFTNALLPGAMLPVPPQVYLALPAVFLGSLCFFAWIPLARIIAKVIELSGCLLGAVVGVGILGALSLPIATTATHLTRRPMFELAPPLALSALALWPALLLAVSWRWCEPSTWRLSPDGTRSAQSVLRAVLVLGAIAVSIVLLFQLTLVLAFAA